MSGICGWLAASGQLVPDGQNQRQLADMAAPLMRFDGSALHAAAGSESALAVAAQADSVHLYQHAGLLVALWGRATLDAGRSDPACAGLGARLAQLWRSDGAQACAALSGPFALCILDEFSGEALLAIDRSGTHTLSFQCTRRGLLFASSADALIAHPAARRDYHPQAIYDYLYFHMIPAPDTIYSGQQRLAPGEYVHYRRGKLERGRYWKLTFDEQVALPFETLKQTLLDTLRGAVRATLGEHQVGAFLSGGTDSSTVAAMLGQVSGAPARTYSIGFDAPGYDEMAYARLASRHFGTVHHELYVTPDDVLRAIPQIAAVFDQPFGNASAIPAFYCAQMARADGITRLLGGDGGDELFGGNERYARQAVFSRYEQLPSILRQTLIEPLLFKLAGKAQHRLLRKARSYIEQALVPLPARLETYNLLQHYGHRSMFEPGFLNGVDPGLPLSKLNAAYWLSEGQSQINQMLALDMQYTLADNDLPKVCKACELAGVDAAFPLLDDALVAFAARLPPRQKLNGTRLRYFFKQALADTLPRAILRKQKHGFGLPFGLWLQQHQGLKEIAFDSLSALKRRHIVRADFIDDLLQRQLAQHPGYHGTMVWVLMMLEQWFSARARH